MARPTSPTILPDHASVHLVRLEADEQFILAVVAPTALEALCQCLSESIHSRYVRLVADLPWAGWAVRLELHVRRFFCQKRACRRQIFTERVPNVVAPSARRTLRLTELFTLIGFADGEGKQGSAWSMGWG
jgi:transposase